jgi:GAF domain-containing protein
VGLYDVLPEEIAVIAWSGPGAPAFPRFPRTEGLSGAAVRAGEPVVVQDVSADPRYLTTLGNTRAEAIFPVKSPTGAVVGTVDVESERANAFTDDDRALLEACAAALARLWA